ncbi:hypothetical protein HYX14_01335 [Candidatus Woesearchaeota archaeon]|nr:hypothetical protein [Candidatus Woesearchaeota archaeon]
MLPILEEKLQDVSNRSLISAAVNRAAALDYDSLKTISNDSGNDSGSKIEYTPPGINYEEKFLAEQFYSSTSISPLAEYETVTTMKKAGEEYDSGAAFSDSQSETLTTEEAREMIKEVQYATVTGSSLDIDWNKRERFTNWAMFEPALRNAFEKSDAVTRDVNYSRTF